MSSPIFPGVSAKAFPGVSTTPASTAKMRNRAVRSALCTLHKALRVPPPPWLCNLLWFSQTYPQHPFPFQIFLIMPPINEKVKHFLAPGRLWAPSLGAGRAVWAGGGGAALGRDGADSFRQSSGLTPPSRREAKKTPQRGVVPRLPLWGSSQRPTSLAFD